MKTKKENSLKKGDQTTRKIVLRHLAAKASAKHWPERVENIISLLGVFDQFILSTEKA